MSKLALFHKVHILKESTHPLRLLPTGLQLQPTGIDCIWKECCIYLLHVKHLSQYLLLWEHPPRALGSSYDPDKDYTQLTPPLHLSLLRIAVPMQ